MITLHTFSPRYGLESLSPFCMKVEVYLKLARIDYEVISTDPRKSPKGKLPWVKLEDGSALGDSEAIIAHFESKRERRIDDGLDELELARAHVIRRTIEEGFYFVALWSRWCTDAGWAAMQPAFEALPAPVRWLVTPIVRKQIAGQARAQGTGRHTPDEIYELGRKDLHAVMKLLAGKPFFLGDQPRLVDVSAYAFFANVIKPDIDTPLREIGRKTPGLPEYVERMAEHVAKVSRRK